jgi:uncharacterized protein (DUF2461 family)
MPEAPILGKIRDGIVAKPATWEKARKVGLDNDEGGSLKRAPKGFAEDHKFIEDLKRKSFTTSIPLTPAQATADDLPKQLIAAEKKMRPLNDFLVAALT